MSADLEPTRLSVNRSRRLVASRAWTALVPWAVATVAACWLYFGRTVFIPITLAVFLSFLLSPIVAGFRRIGLPRRLAVLLALMLALAGIGVTGAVIVSQAATLGADAPAYAERIAEKATTLRASVRDKIDLFSDKVASSRARHVAQNARQKGQAQLSLRRGSTAIPVEVQEAPQTAIQEIRDVLVPALAPIETTLIVLVVTIFILFQREDLRDRLIRLIGTADLHRSTIALDDAAKRLSRYFLSQFIVNCGFGSAIWLGLYLLGVPSPGLWGILAGLLRFVPYVGSVIAAVGPLAIAAAIDPGWKLVTSVALLFLILEPLVGYAVEPMVYGRSTGLSPVSVVVAALFWTWIWGPVGLVLSMPLTLMLVVLGRHVPALEFFDIMLGDRPALSPAETFYQRSLAGHADDALEHAEELLETRTLASYYDEVVLPGMRLAAADMERGVLERSSARAVGAATAEVMQALAEHDDIVEADAQCAIPCSEQLVGRRIICVPGPGPLDNAISATMAHLLRRCGALVREEARDRLRASLASFDTGNADTVCILGLFDERATGRLEKTVRSLTERASVRVVVGVRRSDADIGADGRAEDLPANFSDMLQTLQSN